MSPPVHGDCESLLHGVVELSVEELQGLLLGDALVELEASPHVLEVGLRLQLGHAGGEHHGQQADQ